MRGSVYTISTRHCAEILKGILYQARALTMVISQFPAYADKLAPFASMKAYHENFPIRYAYEDPTSHYI